MDLPPPTASLPTPAPGAVVLARPIHVPHFAAAVPSAPSDPMALEGLSRGRAALYVFVLLAAAVCVPMFLDVLTLSAAGGAADAEVLSPTYLVSRKVFDAGLVAALAAFVLLRNRLPAASVGLTLERTGWQGLAGLAVVGAIYVYMVLFLCVMMVVLLLFPSLQKDLAARGEFIELMPVDDVWTSLALLIPVAIHEELLFRGLLLPCLRRATGGWTAAMLISSALFAVLHIAQGWLGVVQVFGLSMIFSVAFVRTRSLLVVIVAHFLFDFLQFQLIRLLRPLFDQLPQMPA